MLKLREAKKKLKEERDAAANNSQGQNFEDFNVLNYTVSGKKIVISSITICDCFITCVLSL